MTLTHATARAIVEDDDAYTITVGLVTQMLQNWGVPYDNREIIADLIMSAIAAAFIDGARHKEGVQ